MFALLETVWQFMALNCALLWIISVCCSHMKITFSGSIPPPVCDTKEIGIKAHLHLHQTSTVDCAFGCISMTFDVYVFTSSRSPHCFVIECISMNSLLCFRSKTDTDPCTTKKQFLFNWISSPKFLHYRYDHLKCFSYKLSWFIFETL